MPVDVEDAVDLGDEPVGEAKVSVGRADDRGESCRVGETCVIRVGVREALCDDDGEFVYDYHHTQAVDECAEPDCLAGTVLIGQRNVVVVLD